MSGYGMSDDMFGKSFEKKESYKLKQGEHKIRLLPAYAPQKLYAFVRLHWFSNDQGEGRIPVRCPADRKKGSEEICPQCKIVSDMRIKAVNMIATGQAVEGKELEEQAGSLSAKATYLWQVLDSEGNHKLMSLSYRAHESLSQLVGFWWKQKKIDITLPERNHKIYCNRTGQKSQTNYAWAVLDRPEDIRKVEVPKLWDLDKHHECKNTQDFQEIVTLGYVPKKKKEMSDDSANTPYEAPNYNSNDAAMNNGKDTRYDDSIPDNMQEPENMGMANFTHDDIPF